MKKKVDVKTSKEIGIDLQKSNSLLIVKPDPFEMAFEPRSRERKEEIVAQWEVAESKDREERAEYLRRAKADHITAPA